MTKAIRFLIVAALTLMAMPVPGVAAEHGAEEEPQAEHGETSKGAHAEGEAEAKGETEAKGEEAATEEGEPPPPSLTIFSPEDAAKQPFGLVRTLQSVQDQIAQGSASSHEFQKRYIAQLNADLRNMPPEVWDDPRNARAAVVFALSGGDPKILNDLKSREPAPPIDPHLLKGALAFGEGRAQDAIQHFEELEVRKLDAGLAGLVALIHGTLIAKSEPKKAIKLFDEARLVSPGTLVEESALRQEILLLAHDGNFERFDALVSQYTRRFGKSIYARNFRRQFFAGVARQDFAGTSEWISRTEAELQKMPQTERGAAYLSIAEEATLAGNIAIVTFAATKAADLAKEGSAEQQRARLYEGAAMLVTEDYEKGVAALNGVAKQKLRPAEREIRDAALTLAQRLRSWPEAPAESSEPLSAEVTKAQGLISDVDSLLAGGAQ